MRALGKITKDEKIKLGLEGFLKEVKKIGRVFQAEGIVYGEDKHVMCTNKPWYNNICNNIIFLLQISFIFSSKLSIGLLNGISTLNYLTFYILKHQNLITSPLVSVLGNFTLEEMR